MNNQSSVSGSFSTSKFMKSSALLNTSITSNAQNSSSTIINKSSKPSTLGSSFMKPSLGSSTSLVSKPPTDMNSSRPNVQQIFSMPSNLPQSELLKKIETIASKNIPEKNMTNTTRYKKPLETNDFSEQKSDNDICLEHNRSEIFSTKNNFEGYFGSTNIVQPHNQINYGSANVNSDIKIVESKSSAMKGKMIKDENVNNFIENKNVINSNESNSVTNKSRPFSLFAKFIPQSSNSRKRERDTDK